ncbi:hypothetical protein [Paraburkholderia podalyriae]|uniref:hypothetical protein n=1 Tax=Paraburkholderia TaxID=1822464 RepID=UPI001654EDB4|nr:hypothetical protein [Paraburkholderia podalyriae]
MNGLKAGSSARIMARRIATRNTAHNAANVQRGESLGMGSLGPRPEEKCISDDRHA